MIRVGVGARPLYTRQPRPTDVDLVGQFNRVDPQALDDAGFFATGQALVTRLDT